jgi:phenylalanyl-tRNA synthetase beta chain
MKISTNWLKELVKTDLSVAQISHTLTMAGLEVEEESGVAAVFDHIVVAEVKTVAPHPNADKLRVCEVDAGTGTVLQIVCGAPNVTAGMRVPCALVGAKLPGLEIKAAKLRGVESNGMLCSARELGISEEHGGLLALPADAPIGQSIRQYLDLDDVYLTLKLTPNRGDCLSVNGVARDLAAMLSAPFAPVVIAPNKPNSEHVRGITLAEPRACSRYCGRVIMGLNAAAPTPDWMVRRLERAGFRSISALVDITNYLTLALGRPMHAFDNDKLQGDIVVRYPKAGETLTLLNDQEVALAADMLLIADANGPLALGGVMGGKASMVDLATKNVFFEAAYFDPDVIQGKTRQLGINSDAAFRFERGVDPESCASGIEYATTLAIQICGSSETQIGPLCQADGAVPQLKAVRVRPDRVVKLLGVPCSEASMFANMQALNCSVVASNDENGKSWLVTPPSYRFDLNIEEDFIEEIARSVGFDAIPVRAPQSRIPMLPEPEGARGRKGLRRAMVGCGYQEVINYSFISDSAELAFTGKPAPVVLANPIASHMNVMRTSLVSGLVETVVSNLNRGEVRLRLFEIGRCFLADSADLAQQPEKLAGIAYGSRFPEQWGEDKAEAVDFFSVKGDLLALLNGKDARFEPISSQVACHPGRCANVIIDNESVGFIGELHPKLQQKYGLSTAPIVFEIDTLSLLNQPAPRFIGVSKMQSVRRDIAFILDETVLAQQVLDAVNKQMPTQVVDFALFDQYRGQNLPAGKKSLAFRVVMQDTESTLTDIEADQKIAAIVKVVSDELGASLR